MRTFLFLAIPLGLLIWGGEISQSIYGEGEYTMMPGLLVVGGLIMIAYFNRHRVGPLLAAGVITGLVLMATWAVTGFGALPETSLLVVALIGLLGAVALFVVAILH